MADITANLQMPYILPSQAQKHVTHNEALQRLDAVVQLCLQSTLSAPPSAPDEGACYFVGAAPSGAWSGKAGLVALRQDGAWIFLTPRTGWRGWFAGAREKVFDGSDWTDLPLPPEGVMQQLGINATADSTNRLSVSAAATLLSHEGNGHQLKINKAASGDTGSLLFQTGWSGRAEMGLAGDDRFSVKVSGNGSDWFTGLTIAADGTVRMPQRPLVLASLNSGIVTPASGTSSGFQQLPVNQGGFLLGTALAGGTGNRLLVPQTGLYQLTLVAHVQAAAAFSAELKLNGSTTLAQLRGISTSGSFVSQTVGVIASLTAGDTLALSHAGSAQFDCGAAKTALMAVML